MGGKKNEDAPKFEVRLWDATGELIESLTFELPDDLAGRLLAVSVFAVEESDGLPDRSPLHEEALNREDLRKGLLIQRYSRGKAFLRPARINGEPFLVRGSSVDERLPPDTWRVPVITADQWGYPICSDWLLADMGVVPIGTDLTGAPRWSDNNYTLAVGEARVG